MGGRIIKIDYDKTGYHYFVLNSHWRPQLETNHPTLTDKSMAQIERSGPYSATITEYMYCPPIDYSITVSEDDYMQQLLNEIFGI